MERKDMPEVAPETVKPATGRAPIRDHEEAVAITVVVNTCDRQDALRTLLYSLNHQSYSNFEVVVVVGPTNDDSENMIRTEFGEQVHVARCAHFNLSCSRNVGLAHAAGDVVAFIDDDAVAARHWLRQLADAFREEGVSGAGGRTYNVNPGAASLQFLCGTVSVLAEQVDVKGRNDERPRTGAPQRWWFPRFHGTNMSYRRSALLSVDGFDERFEYLFDDADIAVRLGLAGHELRHIEEAAVYHFPGTGRNRGKHPYDLNWYCWLRSTVYFALKNGGHTIGRRKSLMAALRIISWFFAQLAVLDLEGKLPPELHRSGRRMLWKGAIEGLFQGLFCRRRIPPRIDQVARSFAPFKRPSSAHFPSMPAAAVFETCEAVLPLAAEPLCIAFLADRSADLEPGAEPECPRRKAVDVAAAGHEVHLIGPGPRHRIVFCDGIFIHEVPARPRNQYRGFAMRGFESVAASLDFSHAAYEEIRALVVNNGVQLVDATDAGSASLVTAVAGLVPLVMRRPIRIGDRPGAPHEAQPDPSHGVLRVASERRAQVLAAHDSRQQLIDAYRAALSRWRSAPENETRTGDDSP